MRINRKGANNIMACKFFLHKGKNKKAEQGRPWIYIDEINDFEFSFVTNSLMGAMKVKLIENTKYNNDNILFKKILSKLT